MKKIYCNFILRTCYASSERENENYS